MKIYCPIPVFGRLPLVQLTVERLIKVNNITPIMVGHEPAAKLLADDLGVEWVEHPNSPLGAKWNAGFYACKRHNPDAVLYAGSSDWVHPNYIQLATDLIQDNGDDIVGSFDCTFVDVAKEIRVAHWPGYDRKVRNETIGIGRLLSKWLLHKMEWHPFNGALDNSLDRSMTEKAHSLSADHADIFGKYELVSISTNLWDNKHKFHHCLNKTLPSEINPNPAEFLKDFPEIYKLQEHTKNK